MPARNTWSKSVFTINNALQNGLEVIRFGGLRTGEEPAPFDVVHRTPIYRLRHYFSDHNDDSRPTLILVPPLMVDTSIYDVSHAVSAVRQLDQMGINTYVLDFGPPESEQGGMNRSLTDHVLAVDDAIDYVREREGLEAVHLSGYSQGGIFCYLTAAYRKCNGIASVITFGSPIDMTQGVPDWMPVELVQKVATNVVNNVVANRGLPGWLISIGFQGMDPVSNLRHRLQFITQLHNREALLPKEGQRRFIEGEGFVGYAGPAIAELINLIGAGNHLLSGGFDFLGKTVSLADITSPVLVFLSPGDAIAAPATVRAIRKAAPLATLYEVGMTGGHMGLVSSSAANEIAWPSVAGWLRWQNGKGERPERVKDWNPAADDEALAGEASALADSARLSIEVASELGQSTFDSVRRSLKISRQLALEAKEQLPQMFRLDGMRPNTRVSMAQLLTEQGHKSPRNVAFLFEGRSHSYAATNERIDNIVKGLISIGVRRGEHVAVLMSTRPSAFSLIAAINRLGAVGVLLRPGSDISRELQLGDAKRIITDPENMATAMAENRQVYVLGGGGKSRDLGANVVDMEQINPDQVELPAWYKANPGRAREIAFLLFTGSAERIKVNRITNGRWALAAIGTASAASISNADTVYGTTIHYHPSGLLTTFGCAIAGGARLALTDQFAPEKFWDEVRRYGATVVSYTWTSLHDVVNSEPHPLEQNSPIRLLIGSGMPVSLWKRAAERFAPARIVEFYASTEGEAVLVNVDGDPIGAKGQPLPGGARVRLARYDLAANKLCVGDNGFAELAQEGEIGMLLAEVKPENTSLQCVLRGMFAADDAWLATGDLFRYEQDNFWFVGSNEHLVQTEAGPCPTWPIEDALGNLPQVDLVCAYGVKGRKGKQQVMADVQVITGGKLKKEHIQAALKAIPEQQRPVDVRIVKTIDKTSWYRLVPGSTKAS